LRRLLIRAITQPVDFSVVLREHVDRALAEVDAGASPLGFRDSTTYDVIHQGRPYPPKQLIALALRHATGRVVTGEDFGGGEGTACFRRLRELGFLITEKVRGISKAKLDRLEYWIGVTDRSWFEFHASNRSAEVNFWAPGGERSFGAIPEGGLFLFKLKSPVNKIVGGGWFMKSTVLPLELAWKVYGTGNGAPSVTLFRENITRMRERMAKPSGPNVSIGCTLLTDCFWLPEDQWIDQPADWSPNIVQGKCYDPVEGDGARVWGQIQERLRAQPFPAGVEEEQERYGRPYMAKPRLGQAGFRVAVLDAYGRRCAVTEEKTLPVLEAAHIRPFADGGGHEVGNGLLLRSDFHTLFDAGYLTIDTDFRLLVSKRIKEEFSNGRHYYEHHGVRVPNLPALTELLPSRAAIEWRNSRWLG
jgi:putative restriction endonuclease